MKTKSEVLKERMNAVGGGCCERFANNQSCDCLKNARDETYEEMINTLNKFTSRDKNMENLGVCEECVSGNHDYCRLKTSSMGLICLCEFCNPDKVGFNTGNTVGFVSAKAVEITKMREQISIENALRDALADYLDMRNVPEDKRHNLVSRFVVQLRERTVNTFSPEEIVAKVFEETTAQPKKGSEVSVIYDIVNYSTMEDMRKMLTNKLSNGWKLAGGLSVQSGSYFQAVTMDVS